MNDNILTCFSYYPLSDLNCTVNEFVAKLNGFISGNSQYYYWYLQIPKFQVDRVLKNDNLLALKCTFYIGDAIDDEWFFVYLLRRLQSEFEKLVVQIEDSDGEFLLIEAGDCLPEWVEPMSSVNRTFLYKQELVIIGPDVLPVADTVEQAIKFIYSNHVEPADAAIQKLLELRLRDCSSWQLKSPHSRNIYALPLNAASIVAKMPLQFVNAAILALCKTDVIQWRRGFKLGKFNLNTSTELVKVQISLPKLALSQLASHPGTFPQDMRPESTTSENALPFMLGIKLSCALEALLSVKEDAGILYAFRKAVEDTFGVNCDQNLCSPLEFSLPDNASDDGIDWLKISEDEFERELERASGTKHNPKCAAQNVMGFMATKSDCDGVIPRVLDAESSDDESLMDINEFADAFMAILNVPPDTSLEPNTSQLCDDDFFDTYGTVLDEQLSEERNLEHFHYQNSDSDDSASIGDNEKTRESAVQSHLLDNFTKSIKAQESAYSGPASTLLWGANSRLKKPSIQHV